MSSSIYILIAGAAIIYFRDTIGNISVFKHYALFFPILFLIYMITSSVMNKNVSFMSYLIGYIFTAVNLAIINGIPKEVGTMSSDKRASTFCGIGIPFSGLSSHASPTTAIISYTLFKIQIT